MRETMSSLETNPRKIALRILVDVERGKFAEDMLEDAADALGQATADLRLVHELVYGIVRRRLLLDTVIECFSKIKVRKLEKFMVQALRIGLYQILFLERIPDSAAVDEAVKLVAKEDDKRPGNFCNAVLRNITRSLNIIPKKDAAEADPLKTFSVSDRDVAVFDKPIFVSPEKDPLDYVSRKYSHPPEMIRRWLERYEMQQVTSICRANNRHPALHVRINGLRASLDDVIGALHEAQIPYELVNARALRLLDPRGLHSEAFKKGMITVQNAAAAEAAPLLNPQPGERVLDLCAAPGGKTAHIAELMGDEGIITAVDPRVDGMDRLKENCERLGITCVKAVTKNALKYVPGLKKKFDRVMLDVPCSNTGVLSRRVEARWRFNLEALGELVEKQKALLETAASAVKKGGVLVYSTCSIEPEENSMLISAFLGGHPEFRLDGEREFLQGRDIGDGGYLARLTRIGEEVRR